MLARRIRLVGEILQFEHTRPTRRSILVGELSSTGNPGVPEGLAVGIFCRKARRPESCITRIPSRQAPRRSTRK